MPQTRNATSPKYRRNSGWTLPTSASQLLRWLVQRCKTRKHLFTRSFSRWTAISRCPWSSLFQWFWKRMIGDRWRQYIICGMPFLSLINSVKMPKADQSNDLREITKWLHLSWSTESLPMEGTSHYLYTGSLTHILHGWTSDKVAYTKKRQKLSLNFKIT